MKNIPRRINRRTFIGTTGTAATGLTLIPGSLILYPLQQDNWWEKEPLRIVELEQGFEYGEKADQLSDFLCIPDFHISLLFLPRVKLKLIFPAYTIALLKSWIYSRSINSRKSTI